jgi:hypothetical protein
MAFETRRGVTRRRFRWLVRIVAGRARHRARLCIAPAPLEHRYLVAMYVHVDSRIGRIEMDVFLHRRAGRVAERRLQVLPQAAVALRALLHLPLAHQLLDVHQVRASRSARIRAAVGLVARGVRRVQCDVRAPRPVATFARNSQLERRALEAVRKRRFLDWHHVGCVTLQAARRDGPVEICRSVQIAGTVHPTHTVPVGHWKLEQPVTPPIRVSLAAASRTHHNVDPLAALLRVRRIAEYGSHRHSSRFRVHPEVQRRIERGQLVLARLKTPKYARAACRCRSAIVGCSFVGLRDILVARSARLGACEFLA